MREYWRGQGIIYLGVRNPSTGKPGALFDVGNAPKLTIGIEVEVVEHKESRTGNQLQDLRLTGEKKCTISLTLEELTAKNLRLFFQGLAEEYGQVSFSGSNYDTAPSGLAIGDVWQLAGRNVGSLVVKDSGSTTLVAGTHYEVINQALGLVKIKSLTSLTQPLKAQYTGGGITAVGAFADSEQEYYLVLDGINTTKRPHVKGTLELFRIAFDALKTFDFITSEATPTQFEMTGSVLYDEAKDTGGSFGGFFVFAPTQDPA